MLRSKLDLALGQLHNIRVVVENSHRSREQSIPYGLEEFAFTFKKIDVTYARTFDYCAAITRAYATFERFVLDALEELIQWSVLHDTRKFSGEEKMLLAYEAGVAEIFRRYKEARFEGVDKANISHCLSSIHSGARPPGKFSVEPFFAGLPNLNLSHIDSLLSTLGFSHSLSSWISANHETNEFLINAGLKADDVIRDLVVRRNEAAHGNELPTDIWGPNEIDVRVDLLGRVVQRFYELVAFLIIDRTGASNCLGAVSAVWKSAKAFEIETNAVLVASGSSVALLKQGILFFDRIGAMQIEGASCGYYFGPIGTKLGLMLGSERLPKKSMLVYDVSHVPGIERLY